MNEISKAPNAQADQLTVAQRIVDALKVKREEIQEELGIFVAATREKERDQHRGRPSKSRSTDESVGTGVFLGETTMIDEAIKIAENVIAEETSLPEPESS